MKKILRPQDVLFLGLSGVIDIFSELKDPMGFSGNAYKALYGWVPQKFRKTNYYQVVYHSLKTGYIEKIIKNDQPYFRLTSKGKKRIQRDFCLIRWQNKKWDGKWRVVIFDIKEQKRSQRDILRRKLKELGFGMIQESVWISPYDLALDFREFVKQIGLGEEVFVMEVSGLLAGDQKRLAAKIWSLEKINQAYKNIFQLLTKLHDRYKTSRVQKEEGLKSIRGKYLEVLRTDPCLPKQLLPQPWWGGKVKGWLI